MGEPAKKLAIAEDSGSNENILETIKKRRHSELVFGFCGAVGAGVSTIAEKLEKKLIDYDYTIIKIKISDILIELVPSYNIELDIEDVNGIISNKGTRGKVLQDLGDLLRINHSAGILAQLAIRKIASKREDAYKSRNLDFFEEGKDKIKQINIKPDARIAWFIDSFKNPEEVEVFRYIYRNMFYLIGVLCPRDLRAQRLEQKGVSRIEVASMIERDQSEENDNGQQLIKTIHLSDFLINNTHNNITNAENELERILKIIFGTNISPTKAEFAMYVAYSAALKSSCLSRQVGAAIVSNNGDIISTGCNDVPKAGGGLYSYEDQGDDCRCLNMWDGACSNESGKKEIEEQIKKILLENKVETGVALAANIVKNTKIKGLTEYSRAVHAEMDAIVAAARNQGVAVMGADMYVTTFPCHNCARHIVAAGLKRVFYIEPYEKSLALKLHNDAITTDDKITNKVIFIPFQGVAPRQYQNLFSIHSDRKKNGKSCKIDIKIAKPINEMFTDRYFDYESKVVKSLQETFER